MTSDNISCLPRGKKSDGMVRNRSPAAEARFTILVKLRAVVEFE